MAMACQASFSLAISNPKSQPSATKLYSCHLSNLYSLSPCLRSHLTLSRHCVPQNRLESVAVSTNRPEVLKVLIFGAPASGKGTQCELITKKYGLLHVAPGNLLRKEVASGTKNGKRAKECMDKGQLVPNEIVVTMVKDCLSRPKSCENGLLLDGYPRNSSQANALTELGFNPDLFIVLDVREEILVERVVGRRLDPFTGRIYHLKYFPPETEAIAARLTQRSDDTEKKVKLRLRTYHHNLQAVLSLYKDITVKVNGNVSKEAVFVQIDGALTQIVSKKKALQRLNKGT